MPPLYARTGHRIAEASTPSAARVRLLSLRAQLDADPGAVRARLTDSVRLALPVEPPPEPALVASMVDVCVQTVVDPHDFEKAVRRAERDGAADLEEVSEILADWTVRRERARLSRARGRSRG